MRKTEREAPEVEFSPPLDRIRETIRRASEGDRSLRSIARELEMVPTALTNFLEGANPRASTRRKLVEWYVLNAAETRDGSLDTASAAVAVLLEWVPLGLVVHLLLGRIEVR
jgi:hypothetical protein